MKLSRIASFILIAFGLYLLAISGFDIAKRAALKLDAKNPILSFSRKAFRKKIVYHIAQIPIDSFSLQFWCYPRRTNKTKNAVIMDISLEDKITLKIMWKPKKIIYHLYTNNKKWTFKTFCPQKKWIHHVLVRSKNKFTLYVDGVHNASIACGENASELRKCSIRLGGKDSEEYTSFRADVVGIAFFARSLLPQEIAFLASQKPTYKAAGILCIILGVLFISFTFSTTLKNLVKKK